MAEMTLIKLGEMVDKPQAKRIQLMARQIEEAKRAEEARKREAEASAADREKKLKQEAMNKRAYETCAPVWRGVLERAKARNGSGTDSGALVKRLSNRSELKIVVSEPEVVRKMPPGTFVAMGTNGLTPVEIRCIAYALRLASVAGAAQLRFEQLRYLLASKEQRI